MAGGFFFSKKGIPREDSDKVADYIIRDMVGGEEEVMEAAVTVVETDGLVAQILAPLMHVFRLAGEMF